MQPAEHGHPLLDVAALEAAHLAPVLVGEGVEVAVLHADDVGVAEREVGVERDERRGAPRRRPRTASTTARASVEQVPADADQQRGEHRLLAGEVPVDGRPADADGGAEVFDRHAVEAAVGEERGGGLEQGGAAVGFGLAALRRAGAVDDFASRACSFRWTIRLMNTNLNVS